MAAPIQFNDVANFPLGVRVFGTMIVPGTSGRSFFVDSTNVANKGDDLQHGGTPQAPFATIDFAIGQCVANQGDVIYVLPGHAETLTTANGINMDVAGVKIIGRGDGRDRPIITLASSVNACITANAANCRLQNIVVDATGIDNVGQGGASLGAIRILSNDFELVNCEVIISTTGNQAVCAVGVSTAAHRAKITDNLFSGVAFAGPAYAIHVYGTGGVTVENIEIARNRIIGDFSDAAIRFEMTDKLSNLYMHDNVIVTLGTDQVGLRFNVAIGSTGLVVRNYMLGTLISALYSTVAPGISNIDNYGYDSDTAGLQGTLIPIVGTTLPASTSLVDQIMGEFSAKHANFLSVSALMSNAAWNTVATHELFTVTGTCRLIIIPVCSTDLTDAGGGTITLGIEGSTAAFIAATTAANIDANEVWLTTTPAFSYARSGVIDVIVSDKDVGYEIAVAALTGGVLDFYCWWVPLSNPNTATVVASTGGAL